MGWELRLHRSETILELVCLLHLGEVVEHLGDGVELVVEVVARESCRGRLAARRRRGLVRRSRLIGFLRFLLQDWDQRDIDIRVGKVGLEGVAAILANFDLTKVLYSNTRTKYTLGLSGLTLMRWNLPYLESRIWVSV